MIKKIIIFIAVFLIVFPAWAKHSIERNLASTPSEIIFFAEDAESSIPLDTIQKSEDATEKPKKQKTRKKRRKLILRTAFADGVYAPR